MRNSRRSEELSKLINVDWAELSYIMRSALIYTYEHKRLKPKDFIESNSKIHSATARKTLKELVDKGLLKRIADNPTSPNAYYVLADNS